MGLREVASCNRSSFFRMLKYLPFRRILSKEIIYKRISAKKRSSFLECNKHFFLSGNRRGELRTFLLWIRVNKFPGIYIFLLFFSALFSLWSQIWNLETLDSDWTASYATREKIPRVTIEKSIGAPRGMYGAWMHAWSRVPARTGVIQTLISRLPPRKLETVVQLVCLYNRLPRMYTHTRERSTEMYPRRGDHSTRFVDRVSWIFLSILHWTSLELL